MTTPIKPGDTFGSWTANSAAIIAPGEKRPHVDCRCVCGEERRVRVSSLVGRYSVGCGKKECRQTDDAAQMDLLENAPVAIHPELELIQSGKLPPSDCISASGMPLWSLAGVAALLGLSKP